jgi:hypothetical protein
MDKFMMFFALKTYRFRFGTFTLGNEKVDKKIFQFIYYGVRCKFMNIIKYIIDIENEHSNHLCARFFKEKIIKTYSKTSLIIIKLSKQ